MTRFTINVSHKTHTTGIVLIFRIIKTKLWVLFRFQNFLEPDLQISLKEKPAISEGPSESDDDCHIIDNISFLAKQIACIALAYTNIF